MSPLSRSSDLQKPLGTASGLGHAQLFVMTLAYAYAPEKINRNGRSRSSASRSRTATLTVAVPRPSSGRRPGIPSDHGVVAETQMTASPVGSPWLGMDCLSGIYYGLHYCG